MIPPISRLSLLLFKQGVSRSRALKLEANDLGSNPGSITIIHLVADQTSGSSSRVPVWADAFMTLFGSRFLVRMA